MDEPDEDDSGSSQTEKLPVEAAVEADSEPPALPIVGMDTITAGAGYVSEEQRVEIAKRLSEEEEAE